MRFVCFLSMEKPIFTAFKDQPFPVPKRVTIFSHHESEKNSKIMIPMIFKPFSISLVVGSIVLTDNLGKLTNKYRIHGAYLIRYNIEQWQ